MNTIKISLLIIVITMLYNNFHIFDDVSRFEYNDRFQILTSKKYRCIRYFMNYKTDNYNNFYEIKAHNTLKRNCEEYKYDILNAKLDRSRTHFINIMKYICRYVIIIMCYYMMK